MDQENTQNTQNTQNDQENTFSAETLENEYIDGKSPKIKHIVISGGVIYGFCFYGCLKYLHQHNFWNINDIESFYATSVGSIFATILALNFDWDTLDDYIIKRPWQKVFKLNLHSFVNCFQNVGILDIFLIQEIFIPLFNAKDIPITVTMKEFYEITKKELHFFCCKLENFELIDISYKTHPDWSVVESVYASSCAPIMFSPLVKEGEIYIDGGLLANNPVINCLNSEFKPRPEEILGINKRLQDLTEKYNEKTNLYEFISIIMNKMVGKMTKDNPIIPNNITIGDIDMAVHDLYSVSNNQEIRIKLINIGIEHAKSFLENNIKVKNYIV